MAVHVHPHAASPGFQARCAYVLFGHRALKLSRVTNIAQCRVPNTTVKGVLHTPVHELIYSRPHTHYLTVTYHGLSHPDHLTSSLSLSFATT